MHPVFKYSLKVTSWYKNLTEVQFFSPPPPKIGYNKLLSESDWYFLRVFRTRNTRFFFERRPTFTRALIWDSQIDSERVERKRTPQYHKKRNFFFILLLINWFTSNREREVGAKKTDQTRQSGRTFDRTFLAHRFPLLLKIGASKEPYSTKLKIREIN